MSSAKEKLKIYHGIYTVRGGKRQFNTDNAGKFPAESTDLNADKGQLFLMADSKFANPNGKNAGLLAIEAIEKNYYAYPSRDVAFSLQRAFDTANRNVYQYAVANGLHRKIGTTCSALVLTEKAAFVAHVGDCRIYRVNLRRVEQLTEDHVRFKPGKVARNGRPVMRKALTRAIGVKLGINMDVMRFMVQRDEYFVLCSDGLEAITPQEIQAVVLSSAPDRAAEKLVEMAQTRGGMDDITVQVVKVYQQFDEAAPVIPGVVDDITSRWSNWPVYFMLILLTTTMAFLVHEPLMQRATALVKWDNASGTIHEPPLVNPRILEEQQLQRARGYFNKGLWDEALKEYRAVLRNNPESIEALDGSEMIARAYTVRGDKSFNQQNWGAALMYYQKAMRLNPQSINLRRLVLRAEKALYVSRTDDVALATAPSKLQYRDNLSVLKAARPIDIIGFKSGDWQFPGLDASRDFSLLNTSIAFVDNLKIKKAFHQTRYDGVEAEVQARRVKGSRNGKYGLIFGHNFEAPTQESSFFLYTVDSNGNFTLQRVSRYSVKILISDQIKPGAIANYDRIRLKVKAFSKMMMLYANGVMIKMLPLDVEQSGGVGLYADPKMQVEFTNFQILPSSYEDKNVSP